MDYFSSLLAVHLFISWMIITM